MLLSHGRLGVEAIQSRRQSGARTKELGAMIRVRAARGRNTRSVAEKRPNGMLVRDKIKFGMPVVVIGGIFYLSSLSTVPAPSQVFPTRSGTLIL